MAAKHVVCQVEPRVHFYEFSSFLFFMCGYSNWRSDGTIPLGPHDIFGTLLERRAKTTGRLKRVNIYVKYFYYFIVIIL